MVFPGQGSQKPGMGKELVETSKEASETFDRISEALNLDIRKLCWETDDETLRQTQNAQVALYACGVAAWRAIEAKLTDKAQLSVIAAAGHSVGEYAAIACAGVVSVEDGAKLVRKRGEVMADSGKKWPGTMAAVIGLDRATLDAVCAEAPGVVVVANDNCPGQLVISGEVDAVKAAGELASQKGAKRVLPLNVSGAFHSPLMEEPAREMAVALATAAYHTSTVRVYANVTSEPISDPSEWPQILEKQLRNPVRWSESVQNMLRDGVNTFLECGGGEVLAGLIRRIDKGARCLKVADAASLEESASALNG